MSTESALDMFDKQRALLKSISALELELISYRVPPQVVTNLADLKDLINAKKLRTEDYYERFQAISSKIEELIDSDPPHYERLRSLLEDIQTKAEAYKPFMLSDKQTGGKRKSRKSRKSRKGRKGRKGRKSRRKVRR